MDSTHSWGTGRMVELDDGECWDLTATQSVGRLAWNGPEGPMVIPVNFAVADRVVVIRTAAYSSLAREVDESRVAFEIDQIDDFTRSAWSVLIRGRARIDYGPGLGSGQGPSPDVWPAGVKALQVVVEPTTVSGRRLLPS